MLYLSVCASHGRDYSTENTPSHSPATICSSSLRNRSALRKRSSWRQRMQGDAASPINTLPRLVVSGTDTALPRRSSARSVFLCDRAGRGAADDLLRRHATASAVADPRHCPAVLGRRPHHDTRTASPNARAVRKGDRGSSRCIRLGAPEEERRRRHRRQRRLHRRHQHQAAWSRPSYLLPPPDLTARPCAQPTR